MVRCTMRGAEAASQIFGEVARAQTKVGAYAGTQVDGDFCSTTKIGPG